MLILMMVGQWEIIVHHACWLDNAILGNYWFSYHSLLVDLEYCLTSFNGLCLLQSHSALIDERQETMVQCFRGKASLRLIVHVFGSQYYQEGFQSLGPLASHYKQLG